MDAAPQTLLDDDVHHEDGQRAVDRRIFVDPDLFELEQRQIWKRSGSMLHISIDLRCTGADRSRTTGPTGLAQFAACARGAVRHGAASAYARTFAHSGRGRV